MVVTLLYFAGLREALGTAREQVELPADVTTLLQLRQWLIARGGAWADQLSPGRATRAALDQTLIVDDASLHDGAEVAFFPPVTGG